MQSALIAGSVPQLHTIEQQLLGYETLTCRPLGMALNLYWPSSATTEVLCPASWLGV